MKIVAIIFLVIIATILSFFVITFISNNKNNSTSTTSTPDSKIKKIISILLMITAIVTLIIGARYVITNWDEFDFSDDVVFDQQVRPRKGGTPAVFNEESDTYYSLRVWGIRKQYIPSPGKKERSYAETRADGSRPNRNNTKHYDRSPHVLISNCPWAAAIVWINDQKHCMDANQSVQFNGVESVRIDINVEQNISSLYTRSEGAFDVKIKRI